VIKSSSREKLHRAIISALLQSSIPLSELREIVTNMERDPSFLAELADLLRPIVHGLKNTHRSLSSRDANASYQVDEIVALVAKRRLTKSSLISMLLSLGHSKPTATTERKSIRDIVTEFLDVSSITQVKNFMKILEERDRDPYLEGISAFRRDDNSGH